MTNDLTFRTAQHRDKELEGFTKKYSVHMLVWFEEYGDIGDAITREKRIKKWKSRLEAGAYRKEEPGLA